MYTESTQKPRKNKFGLTITFVILIFMGLIVFGNSLFIVYPDEYAFVKRFNKVEYIVKEAGPYFKVPFIQDVEILRKNIFMYELPSSDVITKDKKTMISDNFIMFRISDPLKFIQTAHTVDNAKIRIDTIVHSAIKNAFGTLNQADFIGGRSNILTPEVNETIKKNLDEYGIEPVMNAIKKLDLPDDNKSAVYARMKSERSQIAAGLIAEGQEQSREIINDTDKTKIVLISEADAQSRQLIAEGEREYMRIISEAYNSPERLEFYEFTRSIDALKVSMKGKKTLFLPIDSPLTKLFLE